MYNKNLRRTIFWCISTILIGQFTIYLATVFLVERNLQEFPSIIILAGISAYFSALAFYIIPYRWMKMPTMDFYWRLLIGTFLYVGIIISLYLMDMVKVPLTSGEFIVPHIIIAVFPTHIREWVQSHLKERYRLPPDATSYQFKKRIEEVMNGKWDISRNIDN